MNGNRVLINFQNNTAIGHGRVFDIFWPNNYDGLTIANAVIPIFGCEIYLKNDSIPVTDPSEINSLKTSGDLQTLYYIQAKVGARFQI